MQAFSSLSLAQQCSTDHLQLSIFSFASNAPEASPPGPQNNSPIKWDPSKARKQEYNKLDSLLKLIDEYGFES